MLRKALAQGKVGVEPLAAISKTEDEMKVPKLNIQTPSAGGIAEKTTSNQQGMRDSSAASMGQSNADSVPNHYISTCLILSMEYALITVATKPGPRKLVGMWRHRNSGRKSMR